MERLTYWNCKAKNSALPVSANDMGDTVSLEDICAKLAAYEDTGLEPEEVVALNSELDTAKEAICQMCRKCSEEQHFLCACVSCKYGGKHP